MNQDTKVYVGLDVHVSADYLASLCFGSPQHTPARLPWGETQSEVLRLNGPPDQFNDWLQRPTRAPRWFRQTQRNSKSWCSR